MQALIDWFLFQENAEQKARKLSFSTLYLSFCTFLLSTVIFGVHFFHAQSQVSLVAGLTALVTSVVLYFINNLWVTRGIIFCFWLIYVWMHLNLWPLPLIDISAFFLLFSRFVLTRALSVLLYGLLWLTSFYINDLDFVRNLVFFASILIVWASIDYLIANGNDADVFKQTLMPFIYVIFASVFVLSALLAIISGDIVYGKVFFVGLVLALSSLVLGHRMFKSKSIGGLESGFAICGLTFYLFLIFEYRAEYFIFASLIYLYVYVNIQNSLSALIVNLSIFFSISSILFVLSDLEIDLIPSMFGQFIYIFGGFLATNIFKSITNPHKKILNNKVLRDQRFWIYTLLMLVPITFFVYVMASSYINDKNIDLKNRLMVNQAFVKTRWQSITSLSLSQFNNVLSDLANSSDPQQTMQSRDVPKSFRIADAGHLAELLDQFGPVTTEQLDAGFYAVSDRLITIKLIPNHQQYLIRDVNLERLFEYLMPQNMDWFVELSDKKIIENNEHVFSSKKSIDAVKFSLEIEDVLPSEFSTTDVSLTIGLYFEPFKMSSFLRANPVGVTLYILTIIICMTAAFLIVSRHHRLLELKQLDFYNPQNTETLDKLKRLRNSFQRTKSDIIQRVDFKTREKLLNIIGLLEQVFESKKPLFAFAENKYEIDEAIKYVHHSVENMLEISKFDQSSEVVKQEDFFDISFFTDELYKNYADLFKQKGLVLKIENKSHADTLFFDKKLLMSLLVKLLDNALHFTQKGGVTLSINILKKRLNLTLIDTGIGMDAMLVKQLNEMENQGSGPLQQDIFSSLFLAHVFVQSLKGHMKFFSVLDKGTQVNLSFPLTRLQNDESVQ